MYRRLAIQEFESSDDRHAEVLNRMLSVEMDANSRKIVYQPDARKAGILISELRREKGTGVETPAEQRSAEGIADSKTT